MRRRIFSLMTGAAIVFSACTDLELEEKDSLVVSVDDEFLGVNPTTTLDGIYSDMAGQNQNQQNVYALSVATTDELFIPTRGTDWGDNGVWRDLAKHTWSNAHAYNRATWNELNGNVFKANQILNDATTKTDEQAAEARFLRAFNMFRVLDFWRQIPFREADDPSDELPRVLTVQESVDFIISDLNEAIPDLPVAASGEIGKQNRANQAAAYFLLAKIYLNKHIYLGTDVNSADMDKVIENVDNIIDLGFELQNGFFSIFSPDADSETIFYLNAQYAQRIWGSLHYYQGRETDWKDGGWNGFATSAEFYNKFEGPADSNPVGGDQEERRGYVPTDGLGIGFLFGQQFGKSPFDADGGAIVPLKKRNGEPLIFTKEVSNLVGNGEAEGMRLLKYHPSINMPGTWGNHLLVMRYADAHLMKAEALFRKGNVDDALDLVNELRDLRGASSFVALDEQKLLDERGRELYIEGWRRNDLVRFGQFNSNVNGFVENTSEETNIFPIPDNALGSNPNLKQNPGY